MSEKKYDLEENRQRFEKQLAKVRVMSLEEWTRKVVTDWIVQHNLHLGDWMVRIVKELVLQAHEEGQKYERENAKLAK